MADKKRIRAYQSEQMSPEEEARLKEMLSLLGSRPEGSNVARWVDVMPGAKKLQWEEPPMTGRIRAYQSEEMSPEEEAALKDELRRAGPAPQGVVKARWAQIAPGVGGLQWANPPGSRPKNIYEAVPSVSGYVVQNQPRNIYEMMAEMAPKTKRTAKR
jgi:hypothetical protein